MTPPGLSPKYPFFRGSFPIRAAPFYPATHSPNSLMSVPGLTRGNRRLPLWRVQTKNAFDNILLEPLFSRRLEWLGPVGLGVSVGHLSSGARQRVRRQIISARTLHRVSR